MKEKRLCYISRNYLSRHVAGFKAKQDSEDSVMLMGGVNLGLKRTYVNSKVAGFLLNLTGIVKGTFLLKKEDVLFLQYPMRKYFKFLCRVAKWKGAKVLVLVHDFRCYHHVKLPETVDTIPLRMADYVIVGTEVMANWLRKREICRVGVMGLWDFRSKVERETPLVVNQVKKNGPVIVYAGSIRRRKTAFLAELAERDLPYDIQLYGHLADMPELKNAKHIKVNPFMDSETFIASVEGDFGLIWDSDSMTSCTGYYGVYQGVCLPHKASFYLRAGLPLIVWRGAAIAPVVEQEGIGLTIDSLDDLEKLLGGLSAAQLAAMRKNVDRVSKQLADGHYLRTAIENALDELCSEGE